MVCKVSCDCKLDPFWKHSAFPFRDIWYSSHHSGVFLSTFFLLLQRFSYIFDFTLNIVSRKLYLFLCKCDLYVLPILENQADAYLQSFLPVFVRPQKIFKVFSLFLDSRIVSETKFIPSEAINHSFLSQIQCFFVRNWQKLLIISPYILNPVRLLWPETFCWLSCAVFDKASFMKRFIAPETRIVRNWKWLLAFACSTTMPILISQNRLISDKVGCVYIESYSTTVHLFSLLFSLATKVKV